MFFLTVSVLIHALLSAGYLKGPSWTPVICIIYLNDLPMATKSTESMLFADDPSIFYSSPDQETATNIVNNELADVDLYMKANKLSVNIDKTNFVIFSSRQKSLSQPIPPILYNGVPLKQKKAVKFLGVYVDQHLTWKDHISYISKKIDKSVGIMYRSRFFLSRTAKTALYYSLVYPYLTYCSTVWASTYVTNLNRIFLLQKRAVRAITNSNSLGPFSSTFL